MKKIILNLLLFLLVLASSVLAAGEPNLINYDSSDNLWGDFSALNSGHFGLGGPVSKWGLASFFKPVRDFLIFQKQNYDLPVARVYQSEAFSRQLAERPSQSLAFITDFNDLNIFGRYQVHYLTPVGSQINRLRGGVSYRLPVLDNINVELAGESLVKNSSFMKQNLLEEFRWQLATVVEPLSRLEFTGLLAGHRLKKEEVLVGGKIKLKDYFNTGTDFSLEGYRAGSVFYDEKGLSSDSVFDSFNYLMNPGATGLGAGLKQDIFGETISLLGRINVNFDRNLKKATWEVGVAYNINPGAQLEAGYRSHLNLAEKERVLEYLAAGMNLEF